MRARINSLAQQIGRSAHRLIVAVVERHVDYEQQLCSFVKEALAAGCRGADSLSGAVK